MTPGRQPNRTALWHLAKPKQARPLILEPVRSLARAGWTDALTGHTSSLHSLASAPDGPPRPPPVPTTRSFYGTSPTRHDPVSSGNPSPTTASTSAVCTWSRCPGRAPGATAGERGAQSCRRGRHHNLLADFISELVPRVLGLRRIGQHHLLAVTGSRVEDSDLVCAAPLPDTGQILRTSLTAGECSARSRQLIGQRST